MPPQTRLPQRERWLVCSKIFGQDIYSPGMEDALPAGFPMTGPHWSDYEAPEPTQLGGVAGLYQQARAEDVENDEDDVKENDLTRLPQSTRKKTAKRR